MINRPPLSYTTPLPLLCNYIYLSYFEQAKATIDAAVPEWKRDEPPEVTSYPIPSLREILPAEQTGVDHDAPWCHSWGHSGHAGVLSLT